MTGHDFNRLMGLLAKLNSATNLAVQRDGSFRKYHTSSLEVLNDLPTHLKRIEQGLRTAKVIH